MTTDLQPGEAEVLQEQIGAGPEPALHVSVDAISSPVRTQELPRVGGATFTWQQVSTTHAHHLLHANPRQAKATLISDQPFLFTLAKATAGEPTRMALWPASVPYVCTARTDIYVMASAATANIGVVTENWAAGDA